MVVLVAVCFALCVSLALRALGDTYQHEFGGSWPVIQFAVLLLAHGAAGLASWRQGADADQWGPWETGWGDRVLWLAAIHLHVVTYALNWPVYQGFTGTTELTRDLMPTMAAVLLIIVPSILMYGGPVAAIMQPRRRS